MKIRTIEPPEGFVGTPVADARAAHMLEHFLEKLDDESGFELCGAVLDASEQQGELTYPDMCRLMLDFLIQHRPKFAPPSWYGGKLICHREGRRTWNR